MADIERMERIEYAPHGLIRLEPLMPHERKWTLCQALQTTATGPKQICLGEVAFPLKWSVEGQPTGNNDENLEVTIAVSKALHSLAERICRSHPHISTYRGIFGGIPHVKGVRLSVVDILSHLFVLGSVSAIVERYAPDVTEDQIKDAIAYGQDFLVAALQTRPEADG